MSRQSIVGITVCALLGLSFLGPTFAAGPSFVPDVTFRGSSLAGWHVLGEAEWRAQDGELVGTAKPGSGGGWLVLDKSYQDVGFYASVRCTRGCKTGVLLRTERTPEGMKGVYMSLTEGDVTAYRVKLDAQGRELEREPLRSVGGMVRVAPPPPPPSAAGATPGGGAGRGGGGGRGSIPAPPGIALALSAPPAGLKPGEWNRVELLLDANILRWFLNDSAVSGGVAEEDAGRYGPIALYVGGSDEVHLKDVGYKNLARRAFPAEQVSSRFRMQRLNEFYYAWGAAAADFNRDGVLDVVAGPYVYYGPDYTTASEIYVGQTVNPSTGYPYSAWFMFADDFTGDGWPDIVTADNLGGAGVMLYVNPRGEERRWSSYQVARDFVSEIALLRDVDADGKNELVYAADGYIRYARPDPAKPTDSWIVHNVSDRGPWGQFTVHGLGAGDISGDGRVDIASAWGWWEQPTAGSTQTAWTYHPVAFGRWGRSLPGAGAMGIYDVNGDKLNDIVTALQAHGWGLAWFEQKRDASGQISFVQHMIMDDFGTKNAGGVTFSQLHGSTIADVDRDNVPDFIVGKRYWSHLDAFYDPDPYGPPVVYWYRTVRNPKTPGGAEFVPELIHNRSGVGSDVLAVDLNKDGVVDIVTSTDRGTFIFWGRPKP